MPVNVNFVDAFTNEPFSGNPAAVCCLDKDLEDELKQSIATELNLSETAYVTLLSFGDSFAGSVRFGLRWFTPTNEVSLCGHATLATAFVLFNKYANRNQTLQFETLSGTLNAVMEEDGTGITLDFPINRPAPCDRSNLLPLLELVARNLQIQDVQLSATTKKLVVRLSDNHSRKDLEELRPCIEQFVRAECSGQIKGVIVTLLSKDAEYDFYSRNFSPWNGINEDPVTGSAHTVLAPYWQPILGKASFKARQCSKRGGDLGVRIEGQRVLLTGHATHILEGTIFAS